MEKITLPSLEVFGRRKDHFLFCTPAELAEITAASHAAKTDNWTRHNIRNTRNAWIGNVTCEQAQTFAREGDLSAVAGADALLTKLEHIAPHAMTWQAYDSVVGATPIVPAFLSGSPVNMRTRKRVRKEAAPLSIIVDLSSSASVTADNLRARGVAILALVRMLSTVRPVELWAGCTTDADQGKNACMVYTRIESAPLDLARASFILAHPAASRGLIYTAALHLYGFAGKWPYGLSDPAEARRNAHEIFARAIPTGSEVLFVPPIHERDQAVNNPVAWLTNMLAKHGGEVMQGADA